jgi:hypothetical protein
MNENNNVTSSRISFGVTTKFLVECHLLTSVCSDIVRVSCRLIWLERVLFREKNVKWQFRVDIERKVKIDDQWKSIHYTIVDMYIELRHRARLTKDSMMCHRRDRTCFVCTCRHCWKLMIDRTSIDCWTKLRQIGRLLIELVIQPQCSHASHYRSLLRIFKIMYYFQSNVLTTCDRLIQNLSDCSCSEQMLLKTIRNKSTLTSRVERSTWPLIIRCWNLWINKHRSKDDKTTFICCFFTLFILLFLFSFFTSYFCRQQQTSIVIHSSIEVKSATRTSNIDNKTSRLTMTRNNDFWG